MYTSESRACVYAGWSAAAAVVASVLAFRKIPSNSTTTTTLRLPLLPSWHTSRAREPIDDASTSKRTRFKKNSEGEKTTAIVTYPKYTLREHGRFTISS